MKTNSKKLGYMDMGGNFIDMSNQYQNVEPVSGMGTMVESEFGPKRPKKPASGPRHTGPNATRKNIRQNSGGSKCFKGKCKR